MRKYLTQHGLKAFSIRLPRNFKIENQGNISVLKEVSSCSDKTFLNRFANFIKTNFENDFDNLPVFNFLFSFYDVKFVRESDDLLEFNLTLNKALNSSMWLRLKHTVFNEYNALIGFSEVLKEVEDLDDVDRELIKRISSNARKMFKSTKLLMEFEQFRDFNFEMKANLTQPIEYLSSYLLRRSDKEENLRLDYDNSGLENIAINIENEFFKTSLDLFFNNLKEIIDLSTAKLKLTAKQSCHLRFECKNDDVKDAEFIHEIQLIKDFLETGKNLTHISNRMFELMYVKLISEKLGGEFNMEFDSSPGSLLVAEWIFPLIKTETNLESGTEAHQLDKAIEKNSLSNKNTKPFSIELRKKIAKHFFKVNGTYVLDEWKAFADQLDIICINFKGSDINELKKITHTIRIAIDAFDVTALQRITSELMHISKTE